MEIVYVVYHDTNKEARSMEMLLCLKKIGSVHMITYAKPIDHDDVDTYIINKRSPFALFEFLNKAKRVLLSVRPSIAVLHDNDCAVLIPFIKRNLPETKIVYDSSELYIKYRVEGMEQKQSKPFLGNDGILVWIKIKLSSFRPRYEKRYLKFADLVFAANIERASIMKDYFQLRERPLVFNNVHRIDDQYDEKVCNKKYGKLFDAGHFVILFGGGISEERKTFDYVKAMRVVDKEVDLIIVGSASASAKRKFDDLIEKEHLENRVRYLGFVSRAELRYLMKYSQASVVIFDTYSCNTLFCESGKCYESLFEGTPILASENPPLKRLCGQFRIGVSNNDYAEGIRQLREHYNEYIDGVRCFIDTIEYEKRLDWLTKQVKRVVDHVDE